jgi:hypothetical protein
LIDHLLAGLGLRVKHNVTEYFKRSGDPGEVNDLPPQTDTESCPAEPDSAATLTSSLQSDLGGTVVSLTWAVEKPAGVQVRPQTRSHVPKSKGKGGDTLKDDKDAVAEQKSAQKDARGPVTEDSRDKVVVEDEPVDLDREIQEEIENTDPDRWRYQTERTKEMKGTDPTLCDSSPDSGEEEEVNKEECTSDDAYFKQTMTEMGKKRTDRSEVD